MKTAPDAGEQRYPIGLLAPRRPGVLVAFSVTVSLHLRGLPPGASKAHAQAARIARPCRSRTARARSGLLRSTFRRGVRSRKPFRRNTSVRWQNAQTGGRQKAQDGRLLCRAGEAGASRHLRPLFDRGPETDASPRVGDRDSGPDGPRAGAPTPICCLILPAGAL